MRSNRSLARLAAVTLGVGILLMAAHVPSAMASSGKAYMGVQLQALDETLMDSFGLKDSQRGVLISGVEKDSPADKAGLKRGDVITQLGADRVRDPQELTELVGKLEPDAKVVVQYIRKGKPGKLTVVLGERPEEDEDTSSAMGMFNRAYRNHDDNGRAIVRLLGNRPTLGVQVQEMTPQLGRYFGTDKGLLVLDVSKDSPAQEAGIEQGDVIVAVAGKSVEDVDDLHDALSKYENGDKVDVTVLRDHKQVTEQVAISDEYSRDFDISMLPQMRWYGDQENMAQLQDHLRALKKLQNVPEARVYQFDRQEDQLRESLRDLQDQLKDLREQLDELRSQRK